MKRIIIVIVTIIVAGFSIIKVSDCLRGEKWVNDFAAKQLKDYCDVEKIEIKSFVYENTESGMWSVNYGRVLDGLKKENLSIMVNPCNGTAEFATMIDDYNTNLGKGTELDVKVYVGNVFSQSGRRIKLSQTQIKLAEKQVAVFLAKANPKVYNVFEKYQRQYIGLEVNGRKVIVFNFFILPMNVSETDLKKGYKTIDDGGDSVFTIKCYLDTMEVYDFRPNGEA